MLGSVKMPGGVLVFGVIAAADVAAVLAHAQMHPVVAPGQALRTNPFGIGFQLGEGGEVLANGRHGGGWLR